MLVFRYKVNVQTDTITRAIERYTDLTFPHPSTMLNGLPTLSINIADNDESHPMLHTNESYALIIDNSSATLSAQTIYGALRGLETFSQLVTFDYDTETYQITNGPWVIRDTPRFNHRGLMIDSARHYLPVSSILSTIDSLAYAKLNVLHWHVSDEQSFPIQIKSYPLLWEASFSRYERYTQATVAKIVEYARDRGVRVIIEFDTPGHAASWGIGYPDIIPRPNCSTPLNVANNKTFDVITAVLSEMTGGKASGPKAPSGLFPDEFIHLGGDEVS